MSGFEVAGLVLGIVPIVIEALKAFNESKKFYHAYRNKTALISDLILDLDYFNFLINEQVAKVLDGAGLEVTEEQLRCGHAARILRDPQQNDLISRHLGAHRFNLFVHQLVVCQDVVGELVGRFEGLVPPTSATAIISPTRAETLQRLLFVNQIAATAGRPWEGSGRKLKFSYKKPEIDSRMQTLKAAVDRLKDPDLQAPRAFVCAETVPSEVSSRALKALTRSFEVVQQQAARLYKALASVLPRSCHQQHSVRLFLNERTGVLQQRHLKSKKQVFHIELLGYAECGSLDVWHKCDIPADDLDEGHDSGLENAQHSTSTMNMTTTTTKVRKQLVNWQVTTSSNKAETELRQINCFCVSVREAAAWHMPLELRLAGHGTLCYKGSPSTSLPSTKREQRPLVTLNSIEKDGSIAPRTPKYCTNLEEIIKRAANPNAAERNWTFTQRMVLALRLSCSLLQLNRTHWLSSDMASSSIFFQSLAGGEKPGVGSRSDNNLAPLIISKPPFDAENPFVTQSDPPGFFNSDPSSLVGPLVLDLGIVLMELWSLITFDQWRAQGRDNCSGCQGDDAGNGRCECSQLSNDHKRSLADCWLSQLDPGMAPLYRRGVRRCFEFASRSTYTFEDEVFRADFCEGVVKPLWENCRVWL